MRCRPQASSETSPARRRGVSPGSGTSVVRTIVAAGFTLKSSSTPEFGVSSEGLGHAELTLGDYRRLFDAPREYARVDAEAVKRVVATYLVPARSTTVLARPLARRKPVE